MMKNPMLSFWLSAANFWWGHARSRVSPEMYRQSASMMAESTRQMMNFWTRVMIAQYPPTKNKR